MDFDPDFQVCEIFIINRMILSFSDLVTLVTLIKRILNITAKI